MPQCNPVSVLPIAAIQRDDARRRRLRVRSQAVEADEPLQRMAEPAEIGAVAAFLASSDSSFMTASEVAVDGGLAQL